ncbi:MAG: pyridoxal phosphate-dependent decarboxylase family protein [archaeon]
MNKFTGENEEALFKEFVNLLESHEKNSTNVLNYKSPIALKKELDLIFLENNTKEVNKHDLLFETLHKSLFYSPNSRSPLFLSYLYSYPDKIGLLADWLISYINSNVHTFEASPIFSIAEQEIIKLVCSKIGYSESSDGVFGPGGSYSNMLAMLVARQNIKEDISKLVIYTSDQSHYSIMKSAILLGLKKENIVNIDTDFKGKMNLDDLNQKIKNSISEKKIPFFVNLNAGTTVLGSFDNILGCKNILSNFKKIWFHLDAAWGGAVLFSDKYKNLLQDSELCDSVTIDFHKSLNAPLLCSVVVLKKGNLLNNLIDVDDSYLFHENEDFIDMGKKTHQCGRRGDAFKFWLMWKIRGEKYFSDKLNTSFKNTNLVINKLKENANFILYDENTEFFNVVFWVLPKSLDKRKYVSDYSQEELLILENSTKQIYDLMKKKGNMLINYAYVKDLPAAFRLITANSKLNENEIEKIINEFSILINDI